MAPAVTAGDPASVPASAARERRSGQSYGLPSQRDRLVAAMGELTAELGAAAVGIHHVCQRAGVSRRTFYDLYVDREGCLADTHEEAFGRLVAHVEAAVRDSGSEWEDRAVAATQALLGAWDADRVLAHLCLVSSISVSGETRALRHATISRLAELLRGAPDVAVLGELTLTSAIGGVWDLALRTLGEGPDASIDHLGGVAIYLMLSPFVGRRQAAARGAGRGSCAPAYVTRWTPTVVGGSDERGLLVTELTGQTLRYLNGHPGAANIDIARAVDVRHESQMSRHLGRLERAGMVNRRKEGRANAWALTARGEEAARTLRDLRSEEPPSTSDVCGLSEGKEA
jgi:AcrR family transcriptional regulator/DNA-binding MarR family transcriptional regulator